RYEVGLFKAGEAQAVAVAYFVHVFVDPQTRRPVPLSEEVKAAMRALMLDAAKLPAPSTATAAPSRPVPGAPSS
ncbi:MAG: acyl-CoA thioesterase, partial [Burkholderiales bacterium]